MPGPPGSPTDPSHSFHFQLPPSILGPTHFRQQGISRSFHLTWAQASSASHLGLGAPPRLRTQRRMGSGPSRTRTGWGQGGRGGRPIFLCTLFSLLNFVPNPGISTLKSQFLNEIRKSGFLPPGGFRSNREIRLIYERNVDFPRLPFTGHRRWKP